MKWKVDDVPVFLAVVAENGITAAAHALKMPKSTVSASLSRLELGLGFKLLERNSRNLRVTTEGDIFYRQALLIMDQVRDADATAAGLSLTPTGRLTVALPPAFAQEIVAPHLSVFHAAYPEIELELIITGHGLELLRDKVDISVVVGSLEDSDLISRKLISGRLAWVASPTYLASNPIGDDLTEIRNHVQICEKRYGLARMPVRIQNTATQIDLTRGITHVNDPLVVRGAVASGAGISVLPLRYCKEQIAQGSLVEICQHVSFDVEASKLVAVYSGRSLLSPRLRAFLDFLTELCRGNT